MDEPQDEGDLGEGVGDWEVTTWSEKPHDKLRGLANDKNKMLLVFTQQPRRAKSCGLSEAWEIVSPSARSLFSMMTRMRKLPCQATRFWG
jgi:hypothetical protein